MYRKLFSVMFSGAWTFAYEQSHVKLGTIQMEVDLTVHELTATLPDSYCSCSRKLLNKLIQYQLAGIVITLRLSSMYAG